MSSRGGPAGRALAVLAAALVAFCLGAGPAAAHDELVGTDPADGASVDVAPDRVVLTFSAPALELGTEVLVTGPDGAPVGDGPAAVDGTAVAQALVATRPAGAYRVDWRVTSEDGHPATGTFAFTAATGTAPIPSPEPTPSDAPSATPTPVEAVAAPEPTPTAAVAPAPDAPPAADEGPSIARIVAVLAAAAALLVLARLGRAATLRRRAAAESQVESRAESQADVPGRQADASEPQGDVPGSRGEVPEPQGDVPGSQGEVPESRGDVPGPRGDAPDEQAGGA